MFFSQIDSEDSDLIRYMSRLSRCYSHNMNQSNLNNMLYIYFIVYFSKAVDYDILMLLLVLLVLLFMRWTVP